ncbi:MAG: Ubiquinol-cytochrome c reductase cytochrome b/c1 subunit [Hyphomicrobiales bacterium]|nr:Ubiquinol-cytochrome c reductase cytochrome b/c1 subunit [Hyphomicrobiales bacterium]
MNRFKSIFVAVALSAASLAPALAAETHGPVPARLNWSFAGPFGTFDRGQIQRGFRVYREVCAACHSLSLLSFRNLGEPGGPEFSEGQVKALAADYKIKDFDDKGEPVEREGRPADRFPKLFANAEAAAATHGAAPPDLSVIAKARSYSRGFPLFLLDALPGMAYQEHGVDYIVALLNGYTKADDPNWNEYYPGHAIKMGKPLSDGQVDYTDGSPKTVAQYSRDVSAFLMWAAEPHLEQRKRTGLNVMIFLIVFAGLLYFTKKRIWADAH